MAMRQRGAHPTVATAIGIFILLVGTARPQNPSTAPGPASPPSSPDEGKDIGGYHVVQSIELGGRIADITGSQAMYDTLVIYKTGARIL